MRVKSPADGSPATAPTMLRPTRYSDVQGLRVPLEPGGSALQMPLGYALLKRRSTREYRDQAIRKRDMAHLLWATQGVTGLGGLRTAPSAGALCPLRVYVLGFNVEGLAKGMYRYDPDSHELETLGRGDRKKAFMAAAAGQDCVGQCAAAVLLTADLRRMVREFGDRAQTLALMEAGHAGQNFLLAGTALGLGVIGLRKFDPAMVHQVLELPDHEEPFYVLISGHPR